MKFLQRIALKLINLIVIVSCIAMVVCLFEETYLMHFNT